jgi:hypothetical protein
MAKVEVFDGLTVVGDRWDTRILWGAGVERSMHSEIRGARKIKHLFLGAGHRSHDTTTELNKLSYCRAIGYNRGSRGINKLQHSNEVQTDN